MRLSNYEKETLILYNQEETAASVFTYDPKLIEKLERLAEKYPRKIIFVSRNSEGAVTYKIPKKNVQVREPFSDERRDKMRRIAKERHYSPPVRKNEKQKNGAQKSAGRKL